MLTDLLAIFMEKGVAAIALITPLALGLYGTLVLLDFTWTAIQIALHNGDNMFKTFVNKTVRYGIYFYIIKNYKMILDQVLNSFIKIGLVAGGNTISPANATNPSYIMDLGYTLMDKMYSFRDMVQANPNAPPDGGVNSIVNFIVSATKGDLTIAKLFPNFFFWIVSFLIFVAFAWIAIQLCITWIETYFLTSLAVIFLPFAVFQPFAFLAENGLKTVVGCGTKLMMLLLIVSVSFPILESWQVTGDPSTYESLKLLTCAGMIAFLCWQAPAMAAGYMNGSPSLTTGGAGGGIMAVAGLAASAMSLAQKGFSAAKDVGSDMGGFASGINSPEHTKAAADMTGVSEGSSGIGTPTIPLEKDNAPAGGMTAENISSGIDNGSGSSSSGVSDSSTSGNGSPAGGMTVENVASGIDSGSGSGISGVSNSSTTGNRSPVSGMTAESVASGTDSGSSISGAPANRLTADPVASGTDSSSGASSTPSPAGMKADSAVGGSDTTSASASSPSSAASVAEKMAAAQPVTPSESSPQGNAGVTRQRSNE